MIKYQISGTWLFAEINGKPYSLTADHPQFKVITEALLNHEPGEQIAEMFDKAKAASQFMRGEVEARGGTLFYQSAPVHGVVADRILDFMSRGLPYQPLVAFLQRLQKNPSKRSVEELYGFIEKNELPITEDGFVLGYKGVTNDYKDVHTSTVGNRIGAKPSMPRNTVDDDWRTLCSSGYHIGSQNYARNWGTRTMIVKFDPADAVSVPDGDKLRVCAYEVVAEYVRELPKAVAYSRDPYREEKGVLAFLKNLFSRKDS